MYIRTRVSAACFLVVFLVLVSGCSDDATEPVPDPAIRGQVVDSQGRPVAGAAILLCYEVSPQTTSGSKVSHVINFSMPSAGWVRLWITEPCHGQTVRQLLDEEMSAGEHMLVWDGCNEDGLRQVSGFYVANLETDGILQTMDIFLNAATYAQYLSAEGLARFANTGADGHFSFEPDCLALGREVPSSCASCPVEPTTTTRRITFWAIHENFGAASSSGAIAIDAQDGADVKITFGAQREIRAYAAAHWSEDNLACAYAAACAANPYLDSLGQLYFPGSHEYQDLPLWVSVDEDEAVYLENIGRLNQFVFGWDDFLRPAEFLGETYDFGDIAALNDPQISAHREVYREMLGMVKNTSNFAGPK